MQMRYANIIQKECAHSDPSYELNRSKIGLKLTSQQLIMYIFGVPVQG